MIKRILLSLIPHTIIKQFRNFYILAVRYSQYKTIRLWDCVDEDTKKIPWYIYPAIEYLSNLDFSNKDIFEFGSGNSSLFWARRAKNVISVEHDEGWYQKIKNNSIENQQILLRKNDSAYEETIIEQNKKFDVIIIDGI